MDDSEMMKRCSAAWEKVKVITTEGIPEGAILCIPQRKVNESIDELAERSAIIKVV